MTHSHGSYRFQLRDRLNRTGWWSSSALSRDDNDLRWLWCDSMKNLSQAPYHGLLHVLSVHCVKTVNPRGQDTIRVVLECEEGTYYRDSCGLIKQIQSILDWFGPVEEWPPVKICRPDQNYSRYMIIPQF